MRTVAAASLLLAVTAPLVSAHGDHHHHAQRDFTPAELKELQDKWGTDFGFGGISTFAHLPHHKCLTNPQTPFDIGIIGAPFDTAVSYRPGARFGPRAIRAASARQTALRGYNPRASLNPYTSWANVVDCGDIPITPFDNGLALRQMSEGYNELATRQAISENVDSAATYLQTAKIVTLGGLRTRLSDEDDYTNDSEQGFVRISADDIDDIGTKGVISKILSTVPADYPVYLSIDIDVIDPGLAPGTGTPEPGGWTTRELIRILRGIEGLNVVGADVVEVSPAYDSQAETTALAAAQVVYEIVTSMVRRGLMELAQTKQQVVKDEL
ncbi:Arginase/deacetylase [Aureobasidium sp. EXF-12298]|nr:Arginase/deacetylase [Aureobasidium sp. EXF-12298]